jgi:hypothetical protein
MCGRPQILDGVGLKSNTGSSLGVALQCVDDVHEVCGVAPHAEPLFACRLLAFLPWCWVHTTPHNTGLGASHPENPSASQCSAQLAHCTVR